MVILSLARTSRRAPRSGVLLFFVACVSFWVGCLSFLLGHWPWPFFGWPAGLDASQEAGPATVGHAWRRQPLRRDPGDAHVIVSHRFGYVEHPDVIVERPHVIVQLGTLGAGSH